MEVDEMEKPGVDEKSSPQFEIIYNKLLPFASEINQDAETLLQEIKINLQKSVVLRELRPGCVVWTERLTKFISLYGLKFSKQDHINFVHLFYKLILVPELDASLIALFANVINTLLKKKHLLHPTELVLPWKPLYHMMQRLLDSSYEDVGLIHVPPYLTSVLRNLIKSCRDYFPVASIEEMLYEWRPLLCPFDVSMLKGISLLETFLPTTSYHLSHQLPNPAWLEEFMEFWKMSHNKSSWEADFVLIFAHLAESNIGLINWEPIMPLMFSRFLNNFGLPVGYKKNKGLTGHKYDLGSVVTWIVYCLGNKSSCQDYLSGLFKAIESYYYPSNVGSWNEKLNDFLRRLSTTFVRRLRRERSSKTYWHSMVLDSAKLTETDITRFVQSLLPVSLLAMFSRHGSYEASVTFHQLAQVSPELVIPPLLDKLQSALSNVTEPHQLISVLQCLVSVSRPLVSRDTPFADGPANVLPLLIACLPAIDPNDIRKTMVAFQLVTSIATLVPLIDCSPALSVRSDLTEEEINLCSATAGFEDFVLQFIDRCFVLVENCSHEHTRMDRARRVEKMNRDESLMEIGLSSTVAALLMQCSAYIFDSALSKMQYLVGERTFEPNVAGRFVARMCGCAAKVNSEKALKIFLPPVLEFLNGALTDDVLEDENLDDSILFKLLLLSELIRCPGQSIVPFAEKLCPVLYRALNLRSKEGYRIAGSILNNLLKSLTTVYPNEYCKVPERDTDFKNWLPIREWGKPFDIDSSKISWHIPNEDEKCLAQGIIKKSIEDALKTLVSHGNRNDTASREDVQRALCHLLNCVLGSGSVLPHYQDCPIDYLETCVAVPSTGNLFQAKREDWKIEVNNSTDIRRTITEAISTVVNNMLTSSTEDTTALFTAISIYQRLLSYFSVLKENYEVHQKNYHIFKKILGSNLVGHKMDVRPVVIDRVQLQYEYGVLENSCSTVLTQASRLALKDLFKLAVSRYSEVRRKAQGVLSFLIRLNPFGVRRCLTEDIEASLKAQVSHEEVKGCLYLLTQYSTKQRPMLVMHDWVSVKNLWIALAKISPSEKASIIQHIQDIPRLVTRSIETTTMKLKLTEESVSAANFLDAYNFPTGSEEEAIQKELNRGINNERIYAELVEVLADLMKSDSLHWRMYCLVFNMLCVQLRSEIPATPKVVELFAQNLIHESIAIRKVAIKGVAAILKQQKRKHKKIVIDPYNTATKYCRSSAASESACTPGERWDNSWLQYESEKSPKSSEDWDEPRYVHKTHIGFYAWPKELEIYAPDGEQPTLDRSIGDFTDAERAIFEFFSQACNVDKFIAFLALEERKGKDKFNATRFSLFKGLFRNFGDVFLELFIPHLQRLVCEPHEASQRCAAEIISGLVRGSKLWPYTKVEKMWSILSPLLLKGFTHITVESIADWGTAFATLSESRDPKRMHWIFDAILQEPVISEQGSFIDTNRLYLIQGVIAQQEWRVSQILSQLLHTLRPYLDHPYQSMRSRMGSLLTNIFLYDIVLPGGNRTKSPHVEDFVQEVLPKLKPLKEMKPDDNLVGGENHNESEEEQPRSVRLLKTVCQWLCGMWTRSYGCSLPAQLKLLPYLFGSESNDSDKELSQECTYALSLICTTVMEPDAMLVAIKAVSEIAQDGGWRAKVAALEFLQALIFNNLFNIIKLKDVVDAITLLVLTLLRDNRVEVREKAADVLGGLLHCDFWDPNGKKSLLLQFQNQMKSAKLPKRSNAGAAKRATADPLLERHAGVLGLCAFVAASPYDVPEYIPEVIVSLGNFLHDPPPIPTTIKKTLSNFKRTHQDNWSEHKEKFTDDQLVVLTDLLLSPNYYV